MSGMWVQYNFTTNFADCGKDPKTSSERIDLTSGVSAEAAVEGRLPVSDSQFDNDPVMDLLRACNFWRLPVKG